MPNADEASPPEGGRSGILRIVLWLLAAGLAILFVPLMLAGSTLQSTNLVMETQLADIDQTLTSLQQPGDEEQALRATLKALDSRVQVFVTVQAGLYTNYTNWPAAMMAIGSLDMSIIRPLGIAQNDNQLLLTGLAQSEPTVMLYAQQLRDSGVFERVVVQSIITRTVQASQPGVARPAVADSLGRYAEYAILLELGAATP